jgi:hypothetical protein
MGPHATHELAGGEGGMRHLLEHIGPGIDAWWQTLGQPRVTPGTIDKLVDAYQADGPPSNQALAAGRDRLLLALLETLARERRAMREETT